ncbi:hypothetical protein [Aestuariivirga sp.]|uniref:hypothetical protein n=1 Tax=Aestuariivirga sp. TaxID=2650926 RepID=UPI003BA88847
MNDKNKSVKTGAETRVPSKKTKVKTKTKASRGKLVEDALPAESEFDFVGKVESLQVKTGSAPDGFEFGLRGRHGQRKSFRLDLSDPVALNAMTHILVAAHASEAKIGVKVDGSGEGIPQVKELAWRPKLGKTA